MLAAMADIEIDVSPHPIHEGKGFAVMGGSEGKFIVSAAELAAENNTQSRTAQTVFPLGTMMQESVPTCSFFLVQQRSGMTLRVCIGWQIHVEDQGFPSLVERTPPTCIPGG